VRVVGDEYHHPVAAAFPAPSDVRNPAPPQTCR
jgi:hypothetical protein